MHLRQHVTHGHTSRLEVLAPAKINLFLEVLAKRPDGFHEIRTVLSAIWLFDSVLFKSTDEPQIVLDCRWAHGLRAREVDAQESGLPARELLFGEVPHGRQNLAWRAADLLRQKAGVSRGASICLVKRIPSAAGLGGASSDAAAVLLAANAAWDLQWSRDRLASVAAELGSDVPFFLVGGTALAAGRGERLSAIPAARLPVVVVRPPVGLSTPKVYAGCRPRSDATGPGDLIGQLASGRVARLLVNDLQEPACQLTPWIGRLKGEFARQSVLAHQMSGSGSSYFALARSARQARRLAAALRARNVGWVQAANTIVSNEGCQPLASAAGSNG